jgi:hypothetical protein
MRKQASEVRQPFQFSWEVPEGGYRCELGSAIDAPRGAKPELMLVEPAPMGVSRVVRRYQPLNEETGLFREFAQIKETPEGVIDFANKYGALGGDKLPQRVRIPKIDAKGQPHYEGEPITAWHEEIVSMRRLLQLWDDPIGKREITFRTRTTPEPENIWAEWSSGSEIVVSGIFDPDTYERFKDKPAGVAESYLRTKVNAKLQEHPSTGKLMYERTDRLGLFIVPDSLISALWLQFAFAIDGARKYRSCMNCKKWFEVGGSVRRADARMCGNNCRAAFAYSKKKKQQGRGRRRNRP